MRLTMFSLILYLSFIITIVSACQYNYHCDDNDPTTDDVCLKAARFCLNIPTASNQIIVRTNLSSIIAETNAVPIPLSSKKDVIRAARIILEELNPHRFIHLNIHKVDPVAELRKFEREIKESITNYEFHERMREIFQSMNDFHTFYLSPRPLNVTFVFVGFDMKEFFEKGSRKPKYIVDDIGPSYLPRGAKIDNGSEVLSIDGMDVQRLVTLLGEDGYGSNSAAKNDRGVFAATLRSFLGNSAPRKPSMTVAFKNSLGEKFSEEYPWIFLTIRDDSMMNAISSSLLVGKRLLPNKIDAETDQHIKRSARLAHRNRESVRASLDSRVVVPVNEGFKQVFSAEVINTSVGRIGKIDIPRLFPANMDVVDEFIRLLRLMPKKGLIIDIRGNIGGFHALAKAFTEALSGKEISPLSEQLRATDLVVSALETVKEESEFAASVLPAVLTANRAKEFFSGTALDLGDQFPSLQERVYFGPYVTIVDGRTYSAGDIFALLQRDFGASFVVGTSSNTGAGGAGTIRYSNIRGILPSDLPSLPSGIDFGTAITRFFREGKSSGAIVEFFGVRPDERYYLTKDDILKEDCDLIEYLAKKLDKM